MNKFSLNGQYVQYPDSMLFEGFDDNGSPIFKTKFEKVAGKPKYLSDTIPKLVYGSVAEQVRELFPKIGSVGVVKAHSHRTVISAMNLAGYGCKTIEHFMENGHSCFRIERVLKNPGMRGRRLPAASLW